MALWRVGQIKEEMMQQKAIDHNTLRLRVHTVYAPGTASNVIQGGQTELAEKLSGISLDFVNSDPMAVFFVTGGSEKSALDIIGDKTHVLLLGLSRNNGYAAAAEVQAYLANRGVVSVLSNVSDDQCLLQLHKLIAVWAKVRSFTHKRLGIIGQPSSWLVASNPGAEILRGKFGFRLRVFPWESIGDPRQFAQSADFLDYYGMHNYQEYEEHSRIHTVLQQIIHENQLDGIAVECFSLVQDYNLTACLSLAHLNHIGIPAACEGDLVSLTGMLFIKHITGAIPWMANLSGVYENYLELSHCTIAPDLLEHTDITTHFETGKGLAVKGPLSGEVFTVFRWDEQFEQAIIAVGSKIEKHYNSLACRTQLNLEMDQTCLAKYRKNPLGNHQLVLPGDVTEILATACNYLNIAII